MIKNYIGIFPSGAIKLGPDITCDGFHRDYQIRVQTHIHDDHMHDFERSKGHQNIYSTEPTRQLLISEFNADLLYRQNIVSLKLGIPKRINNSLVELLSADHMIGSAQVAVELDDGTRVGYSGDFQWPLDKVIQVDQLVLDSTYGSPNSIRLYSQDEAEEQLLKIVMEKLHSGPVHVKSHRGTLHRGMQVLSEIANCPMVVSSRLAAEVEIYRQCGYPIGDCYLFESCEAKEVIQSGRYIRMYGKGDRLPTEIGYGSTVVLSAFSTNPGNPVLEYSEKSVRVALTDHADFNGVLNYVKATGASYVITDNSRGGHAAELAQELRYRLGITAAPSLFGSSREWGV
jgi:putative mRNA 3-end processing factor